MEDVDGVERESVSCEIKLQKVKGQGRRTPRKNWGKRRDIIAIYVQCTSRQRVSIPSIFPHISVSLIPSHFFLLGVIQYVAK
jgi:hypothetical protein